VALSFSHEEESAVTRDDWMTCPEPSTMLLYLHQVRLASERRLRLFGVACALRPNRVIPTRSQADLIDLAMLRADGRLLENEIRSAKGRYAYAPLYHLVASAAEAAHELPEAVARSRGNHLSLAYALERAAQAALVREIWGDPFREVVVPTHWATWERGLIPALARGIYDDRTFGRVGILADAIEEAGGGQEILAHFREGCAQVRGCWALDLCREVS
jgi:hypothetical protein